MKKWILLLLILVVTGCSANYNLTITNESVLEDLSLSSSKSEIDNDIFKLATSHDLNVYNDSSEVYEMSDDSSLDDYIASYKYKHDISKYAGSFVLNRCFIRQNYTVNNKDYFMIETGPSFYCIDMEDDLFVDEVRVNITTKLEVLDNNADVINGNVYTWIIDGSNYKNKPISIKIKKDKSVSAKTKNSSIFIVIIALVLVVLFGFGISYFIKYKNSVNNEL